MLIALSVWGGFSKWPSSPVKVMLVPARRSESGWSITHLRTPRPSQAERSHSCLHSPPSTLHSPLSTLDSRLSTLHPSLFTLHPPLSTLHSPLSAHPSPLSTLHPPPSVGGCYSKWPRRPVKVMLVPATRAESGRSVIVSTFTSDACRKGPSSHLSHDMHQLNGSRESTPPQHRQLVVSISLIKTTS